VTLHHDWALEARGIGDDVIIPATTGTTEEEVKIAARESYEVSVTESLLRPPSDTTAARLRWSLHSLIHRQQPGEEAVPTPNASLRGVAVGANGDLWFTENFANKIGRMSSDGEVIGEYDIPTSATGPRCITAMSDGRFFFTQYDVGLIGEVIPQ
jgi:hypothetical protein